MTFLKDPLLARDVNTVQTVHKMKARNGGRVSPLACFTFKSTERILMQFYIRVRSRMCEATPIRHYNQMELYTFGVKG